jgi:hypothetical protein
LGEGLDLKKNQKVSYKGVGIVGQGVVDVVSDQLCVTVHQRAQDVLHHLPATQFRQTSIMATKNRTHAKDKNKLKMNAEII